MLHAKLWKASSIQHWFKQPKLEFAFDIEAWVKKEERRRLITLRHEMTISFRTRKNKQQMVWMSIQSFWSKVSLRSRRKSKHMLILRKTKNNLKLLERQLEMINLKWQQSSNTIQSNMSIQNLQSIKWKTKSKASIGVLMPNDTTSKETMLKSRWIPRFATKKR